ncbi:FAD binding domain-containing protein [Boeremia exigua]|uniref:FAD binding domain-containing protein n=1 Tax=Boeremia exigua TaxID=749465 RepID=UPI001E8DA665|nr:FAD binding domain-containing protein [Boeremia exigua]KAH6618821.1 FAD binding domain-containing protein [Boeremia exigua]
MDYPVLIIGAGPSGATTALLLARMGVKSMSISKHKNTANTPRAHIFNQRAMEVLRDAGLEKQLENVATPVDDMQHTSWLDSLAGEEYGRLWAWGNKPSCKGAYEVASPCSMSDLPQTFLEPVLVESATREGAHFRFNTEFVRFEQAADGVKTTLRDRANGEEFTVTSRYLIGADGARSAVLQALEIPVIGRQLNTAFNIHIIADLSKYIKYRPGSLNWILNLGAPEWSAVGNFRMVRPWNEWVVSMHPATKDPNDLSEPSQESIMKRLHQMIGDHSVDIKILSSFSWTINDRVAEKWQSDRVLCIGDATHRHPPINGLGSNTCISDAFNLAWKLAYVIKGWASPSLLDTLTTERKPVGDAIVRRANDGMEAHRRLWKIIGLDVDTRKTFSELLKADSKDGAELRIRYREALEATEDEVQALGIQMNQTYLDSNAVVVEADDEAPEFPTLAPLRDVKVSTYPGYHLPHVWLVANGQSPRVSTLDLCGQGRFTLLTGIGGDAWISAAESVSHSMGIPIRAYKIGYGGNFLDCYREWHKVRGVGEDGAILVRPDHFVAWRCQALAEAPARKLSSVLKQVLGQ